MCVGTEYTCTVCQRTAIMDWIHCDICPVFTVTNFADKSVEENEQTAKTSPQPAGCRRMVMAKETTLCYICKQKEAEKGVKKEVKKENSLPRRLTRRMTGIFGLDKGVQKSEDSDKLLDKEQKQSDFAALQGDHHFDRRRRRIGRFMDGF